MDKTTQRIGATAVEILACLIAFLVAGWIGLLIFMAAPLFIYLNRKLWGIPL